MKAIDIATEYYSKTIKCSENIFIDKKIFFESCYWARESCREMFQVNQSRQDLVRKIDDIGSEVDKYMFKVRFKMLNSGTKGKNSLSRSLGSSKDTITWLIYRWINVLINISTNPNYEAYLDVGSIGLNLDENMSNYEDTLTMLIKEEEKEQKKRTNKLNKELMSMIDQGQLGAETNEYGNTQMLLIF